MTFGNKVVGTLGLLLGVGGYLWIVLVVRFGYTRLDELLGYFPNSRGVAGKETFERAGLKRRFMEVNSIALLLTFPRYYIRTGELSAEDLQQVPEPLKRYLVRLSNLGAVLVGALMVLGGIVKIGIFD